MAAVPAESDAVYLLRGPKELKPDGVAYDALLAHFGLEPHLAKMTATSLPTTYHHLLRGVGEPSANASSSEIRGDLVSLLQGQAFDRPIEPFPEHVIKDALQLPPGNKPGPVLHSMASSKSGKKSSNATPGLIHAPPPTLEERRRNEELGAKNKERDDKDRRDKKEKKERKKEKRKREDAALLQKVLAPLVAELRELTWQAWVVSGKPGNPFLQKITKENCRRVGVPNYFEFVKEPMDLTRMKEKVEKAEYHKFDQFTNDLLLVVANAKTFNRVGEPVHQMAIELEQWYAAKAATYKTTLEALQAERKKRKKEKKLKKEKKKKEKS